jgi:hypothetical protein
MNGNVDSPAATASRTSAVIKQNSATSTRISLSAIILFSR